MSNFIAAESPRKTGELIRTLFEATAHATGDEFFRVLVSQLATALEARFAFVAELLDGGKNARTLAFWADGQFVDNMHYAVAGTVCETVIEGEIVQINENLHTLYPADEELLGVRLESYLGIPLKGRSGEILGHVVAMDSNPMIEKTRDYSKLEIFAARATAEMERRISEQALRYRVEIEKLVTSISTRFVNLTPEEMESAVDDAIALIGSFTGVDRACSCSCLKMGRLSP